MPDWKRIKAEYIQGGVSYRKLASKYGVSFSTLRKWASKENWTDLRNKVRAKRDTEIVNSVASKQAKKIDRVLDIVDLLEQRIREGIEDGSFITNPTDIRQLMLAIKDIRDVKGMKNELDTMEQMARIEKLRKEARTEEESKDIRVVIEGSLDDYTV